MKALLELLERSITAPTSAASASLLQPLGKPVSVPHRTPIPTPKGKGKTLKGKTPPPEPKLTRSRTKVTAAAPAAVAVAPGSGQKYPYYGIAVGREVKVSTDWPETRSLVNGWPGNKFKGFHDLKQAEAYVAAHRHPT